VSILLAESFFVLKNYQAGCLAYYKSKATPVVVLYTISAELTEKRATKQATCSRNVLHSTLSILLGAHCFWFLKATQQDAGLTIKALVN